MYKTFSPLFLVFSSVHSTLNIGTICANCRTHIEKDLVVCCRKCLSKYHKECWDGTSLRRTEKLICKHCQMYPNDPDRSLISSDIMVCFETGQSAHLTLNKLALLPNGIELVTRQKRENEQFVNRKQSGNQQRSGLVMLFELQCHNQNSFRCCRVYCEMDTAAMSFIPFFPRMCRISLFPSIL